jgi:hypothetical protein
LAKALVLFLIYRFITHTEVADFEYVTLNISAKTYQGNK